MTGSSDFEDELGRRDGPTPMKIFETGPPQRTSLLPLAAWGSSSDFTTVVDQQEDESDTSEQEAD
jgi:hypothetical protein